MVVKELVAKLGLDVDDGAFKAADSLIAGLKTGLFATVASLGAVAAGLVAMAASTADAGNDAYKLSLRLGTTTDAAQELAHAAEATGSSAESLQVSMFHMSRTIEAAKDGSAEAQKALVGLGVPLHDLYKLKPDEQFTRLAGGLSQVKDQSSKAHREQAIFGRGVIDLIPLLARGEAGIRGLRDEAHEMGLVLSEETIKEAREWRLQMREAGDQMDALKFKIGSVVLHGMLVMARAWKTLRKTVAEFVQLHPDNIMNVLKLALWALTAATVVWVATNLGGLGLVAGAYAFMGWTALAAAAKAVLGFALMDATLIGLGLVIFGVILALNDVYHFFKGDKATLIGDTIAYWKREFSSLGDAVEAVGRWFAFMTGGDGWEKSMDKMWENTSVAEINRRTDERRRQRAAAGQDISGGVDPLMSTLANPPGFSPAASAPTPQTPGFGVLAPTLSATFNLMQQPGQDSKELAGQVRTVIEDWHHDKVRAAIAHVK